MSPVRGQCLCGQTKVTIKDGSLPLKTLACHCYNCRTTSGSVMSLVSLVSLDDLEIEGPELGHYRDHATKSGNVTSRYFCKSCGSPVHTQGPSRPGQTVIKLGLFAGRAKVAEPVMEIFWANHEEWEKPLETAKTFEYGPQ